MKKHKMVKPLRYQEFDAMDGVFDGVAGYNNRTNAIGYSFRFFATQMMHNRQVKLLKVDGIAPTAKNIPMGNIPSAPISTPFHATNHPKILNG